MAWKIIHLTQAADLSQKHKQLVIGLEEQTLTVPLEDSVAVILDHQGITLTSNLLARMAENKVALIVTDDRHMPISLTLPQSGHHRQASILRDQINMTEALRKRLWQRLVQAKIENQASNLSKDGSDAQKALLAMAERVRSGDPDNVEARAARSYWSALFDDFIRDKDTDLRNGMLNYGYAIMRSAIARSLVAAGFSPALGVHHRSQTNPYNLADDLIEPFRPFVDHIVHSLSKGRAMDDKLTKEDRQKLATLLTEDCRLGENAMTLMTAIDEVVFSLGRAIEAGKADFLILPQP